MISNEKTNSFFPTDQEKLYSPAANLLCEGYLSHDILDLAKHIIHFSYISPTFGPSPSLNLITKYSGFVISRIILSLSQNVSSMIFCAIAFAAAFAGGSQAFTKSFHLLVTTQVESASRTSISLLSKM